MTENQLNRMELGMQFDAQFLTCTLIVRLINLSICFDYAADLKFAKQTLPKAKAYVFRFIIVRYYMSKTKYDQNGGWSGATKFAGQAKALLG